MARHDGYLPWPEKFLPAGRGEEGPCVRCAAGPHFGGWGGPFIPLGQPAAAASRALEDERPGAAQTLGDPGAAAHAGRAPLPVCRAVATPHLEAARRVALSGGGLCGFTTVRLKNVDLTLTPRMLAQVLVCQGFGNAFDLVYIPLSMVNKTKNRSLAFVNFVDSASAEDAYMRLHNKETPADLGLTKNGKRLEVTPAYVQGFEDNIAWNCDAVVAGQNSILVLF